MASDKQLLGYYQMDILEDLEFDFEETNKKILDELNRAKKIEDKEKFIAFINEQLAFLQCSLNYYEVKQKDRNISNIVEHYRSKGIDILN